ncbi:hypothetical protein B0I35DRAFT_415378 [Stachybotrys elegans]|uniref:Uncharacterized protein n=1 Tax=Stachybotrys elegans TaxID=80388 RepID=A0A8K0SGJ2_9HYPO|nr:hypothetical protein B0I35DRAFT_415378 [Stachybotrys elegans]
MWAQNMGQEHVYKWTTSFWLILYMHIILAKNYPRQVKEEDRRAPPETPDCFQKPFRIFKANKRTKTSTIVSATELKDNDSTRESMLQKKATGFAFEFAFELKLASTDAIVAISANRCRRRKHR